MKFKLLDSSKKGIIVLIHGNSSSTDVFSKLQLEFKSLLPTLPGHEIESNELEGEVSLTLHDMKAVLLNVINQYDEPILLVGNSLGGHIALEIAENVKDLAGLIIFGTPPVKKPLNLEEAFLKVEALQVFLTENPSTMEIDLAAKTSIFNEGDIQQIIDDFGRTDPKVRSAIAADVVAGNWSDQYETFIRLNCNKIIVSGDHDPVTDKEYLKSVIKASAPQSKYVEIKNCGHYPTLEQPVVMSKLINEMAHNIFT
jgi:pimeloyl-ACP methyl ester carboxylesterase